MWLKFTGCDRGSFSGGLLPFLPVCCRDRTERVSAVRATDVMFNMLLYFEPSCFRCCITLLVLDLWFRLGSREDRGGYC